MENREFMLSPSEKEKREEAQHRPVQLTPGVLPEHMPPVKTLEVSAKLKALAQSLERLKQKGYSVSASAEAVLQQNPDNLANDPVALAHLDATVDGFERDTAGKVIQAELAEGLDAVIAFGGDVSGDSFFDTLSHGLKLPPLPLTRFAGAALPA